jgi:hypothetical protein
MIRRHHHTRRDAKRLLLLAVSYPHTCMAVKGALKTTMEDMTTIMSLNRPPILISMLGTLDSITTMDDCRLNASAAFRNSTPQKEASKRS